MKQNGYLSGKKMTGVCVGGGGGGGGEGPGRGLLIRQRSPCVSILIQLPCLLNEASLHLKLALLPSTYVSNAYIIYF